VNASISQHADLNRGCSRRLVLATLAASSGSVYSAPNEKIRIGRSLPLTGPFAEYADQRRIGSDMFISEINQKAGIYKRPIDITTLDDAYSSDRLKLNIQQFDEKLNVHALFGFLGPSLALNFDEIERRRIPLIAATTGASLRDPARSYIFPMRAGFAEETERIVKHVQTIGYRRIALMRQFGPLGDLGYQGYANALEKRGLQSVFNTSVQVNASNANEAASSLVASQCDAILCSMGAMQLAAVLKAYDQKGPRPAIFSFAAVNTSQLFSELGKAATGITVTQIVPSPWSAKYAVSREYRLACQVNKQRPTFYGLEGFLEAKLLVAGLTQAARNSKLDRAGIHLTFDKLGTVNLGNYEVTYAPNRRTGATYAELGIIKADGTVHL
jgi:branched-chain amino acid transport system substrate-binding protein